MTHAGASKSGTLYIVATPIGNLEDISMRAIQTLKTVDIILTEDTRHSQQLLSYIGVKKPLWSYHDHNEAEKLNTILLALQSGQSFALISDAGTPLISDPGYSLVHEARHQGIPVSAIPGPCALITALSAAGIACDAFGFYGFLPAKTNARKEKLASLKHIDHTLIFYESTHRIHACLEDIGSLFGEACELVLAKELTKTFETYIRAPVSQVKRWLQDETARSKGEFVILIPPRKAEKSVEESERILAILLKELPLKQAVQLTATISQSNKNDLYQLALHWQQERRD